MAVGVEDADCQDRDGDRGWVVSVGPAEGVGTKVGIPAGVLDATVEI